eukprot:3409465-Pyramimonas_sp.AAC.1
MTLPPDPMTLPPGLARRCLARSAPPPGEPRPFLVAYIGSQISEFRRRLAGALAALDAEGP